MWEKVRSLGLLPGYPGQLMDGLGVFTQLGPTEGTLEGAMKHQSRSWLGTDAVRRGRTTSTWRLVDLTEGAASPMNWYSGDHQT